MIQHVQSRLDYCKGTLKGIKVSGKRLGDCDPKIVVTGEDIQIQVARCLDCHKAIDGAKKTGKISFDEAHFAKKRIELAIEACYKAL